MPLRRPRSTFSQLPYPRSRVTREQTSLASAAPIAANTPVKLLSPSRLHLCFTHTQGHALPSPHKNHRCVPLAANKKQQRMHNAVIVYALLRRFLQALLLARSILCDRGSVALEHEQRRHTTRHGLEVHSISSSSAVVSAPFCRRMRLDWRSTASSNSASESNRRSVTSFHSPVAALVRFSPCVVLSSPHEAAVMARVSSLNRTNSTIGWVVPSLRSLGW